jgi:Sulfotransferase domain
MGLAVIGAGFGRTGTHSMKLALDLLGLGPCHHMADVMADPAQRDLWRAAARGNLPDWNAAFAGFGCCIDWPSAFFWQALARHSPDARILLTLRSADSWYDSFAQTILQTIGPDNDPASFGVAIIRNVIFGGRPEDREHAIGVYNRHNDLVRASVPAGRLLEYRIGEGWEPLCGFLSLPVPDQPFPRSNSTDEFRSQLLQQ